MWVIPEIKVAVGRTLLLVPRSVASLRLSTMATQRTQSVSFHSSSFRTKEGIYKKGTFQYCRETRKPHSGKELAPVSVSFVSCKDKEGSNEWITFNSAKEFYFYSFYGMRKVSCASTSSQPVAREHPELEPTTSLMGVLHANG